MRLHRNFYLFRILFNFLVSISEHFTRGNRGSPNSNPNKFKAFLTGIGFVSSNKALIIGKAFNWYFKESVILPSKKELVILRARDGFIFERTDITPWPPNDKIGKI